MIVDGVGLVIQNKGVVDDAALSHKFVTAWAFYPMLLTVSCEFSVHIHPRLFRRSGSGTLGWIIVCCRRFTTYALRCRRLFSSCAYLGIPFHPTLKLLSGISAETICYMKSSMTRRAKRHSIRYVEPLIGCVDVRVQVMRIQIAAVMATSNAVISITLINSFSPDLRLMPITLSRDFPTLDFLAVRAVLCASRVLEVVEGRGMFMTARGNIPHPRLAIYVLGLKKEAVMLLKILLHIVILIKD